MINSISLHDFKSHKDTQVDFCPGVNVFVGLSDHGKTNIIRAINWIANNRPLGDAVIQRDASEASVEMVISNAKGNKTDTVRRTKGKSINEYSINGDITLTAFGSDPPPQVLDLLNLSEINLQRQFEPYFLVFDSPGQVATFIRSITKLDEIDLVINIINRQTKQNKIEIEVCNSEMGDVLIRLGAEARLNLEELQTKVSIAHDLITTNEQINIKITRITGVVERIVSIESIEIPADIDQKLDLVRQKILVSTKTRVIIDRLIGIVTLIRGLSSTIPENLNEKVNTVDRTISDSAYVCGKFNRLNQVLTSLQRITTIEIPNIEKLTNQTPILEKEYNESVKKRDRLMSLVDQIQAVFDADNLCLRMMKIEGEIVELKGQLVNCPTCGSDLTEESKKRLLDL